MSIPSRLKHFYAAQQAATPSEYERLMDLHRRGIAMENTPPDRTDAEPDHFVESPKMVAADDDEEIDWGNVASEVNLMLELNGQGATASADSQR